MALSVLQAILILTVLIARSVSSMPELRLLQVQRFSAAIT
jgi:hypothetical protein